MEEFEYPAVPMERSGKIIRRSVHFFLKNYLYFTSTAAFLVLPLSVSILLAQAVIPAMSPFIAIMHERLELFFGAAGFPASLQFFSFLNVKISQTICSAVLTMPFSLSFLLIAKAAIIQFHYHQKEPSLSSLFPLYHPLLHTQLCNSFIILSTNAFSFFLFFLAFNSLEAFGFSSNNFLLLLSAVVLVMYSVILAKTFITCNLALIVSGMENCGGYLAILKACVLIRGRTSTALSLALPVNFGLAALEALFQYRVVRAYRLSDNIKSSIVFEGLLVAYLYSLFIIIDTITTCIFYKSCKPSHQIDEEGRYYRIELPDEEYNSKTFEELP